MPMSEQVLSHIGGETKGATMGDEKVTDPAKVPVPERRKELGRRSGQDRRKVADPTKTPVPDRRTGRDRRTELDRRKGTDRS